MTSEKHHHTCVRPFVRPSQCITDMSLLSTVCVVYHHLPSLFMQCNISDPDAALYYQTQCLVNHLAADMTWHIKSRCCYYFICIVDIGFFHTLIFQAIILKRRPSTTYFKIKGTFICASSNNRKHPFMNSLYTLLNEGGCIIVEIQTCCSFCLEI